MKIKILYNKRLLSLILAFAISVSLLFLPSCGVRTTPADELSFFAMDTFMTLKLYRGEHTAEETRDALSAAKDEILRIEKLFSVTDPESELSALNRGETPEAPSADLVKLLLLCEELWIKTSGAYDITVYPLMLAWGFTTEEGPSVPTAEEIEKALAQVDGKAVTVTPRDDGGYSVNTGGALIDLGSIAKGYAGQRATEILRERGFDSGILILGGNVQTFGKKPDGSGYTVGIADPKAPESVISTVSTDKLDRIFNPQSSEEPQSYAIVTSGTYQRNFTENGKTYHHIMDPITGYPCDNGLASVTVICPNGALADGLSTSLFLLGYEDAMEYYRNHGGFEAIFIKESGEILKTDGLLA